MSIEGDIVELKQRLKFLEEMYDKDVIKTLQVRCEFLQKCLIDCSAIFSPLVELLPLGTIEGTHKKLSELEKRINDFVLPF